MRILARSLMAASLLVATAGYAHAIDTDIHKYVCDKLDDFTANATVVKADQRELGKIGKDFGLAYRFKNVQVRYKEPNKVRMDGRTVDGMKCVVMWNGATQRVQVPKLRLNTTMDLGRTPGKRKWLIDVGLISDYYLNYVNARYMREARVDGFPCAVFDLTYKDRALDTSHHIIYVDPKARVIRKRESYSQGGDLQVIYLFKNVKEVKPGIWFPTMIEAQNLDGVIAGATAYTSIQVNSGIDDKQFEP